MEGLWAADPCPFAPRQTREHTAGSVTVNEIFNLKEDDVLKIGSSALLKKMAWMGDALLDAMVSRVLWEHMGGLADASERELTEQRKRYVCNRNLGIFLDKYVVPFCISRGHGQNEHAKGTIFEALLYISWKRGGDANVRHVVGQLMTWIDAHADECVEMNEVTIGWEAGKSTVLMVTWPDAEGPTEIKSIKDLEEQLPNNLNLTGETERGLGFENWQIGLCWNTVGSFNLPKLAGGRLFQMNSPFHFTSYYWKCLPITGHTKWCLIT